MRKALVSGLIVAAAALAVGIHLSRASSFNPNPVFPIGPISDTTSHQIAKLNRVASKLAGRRTIVNCWSVGDWERFKTWQSAHHHYVAVIAGGVTYGNRIQLSPNPCLILAQTLARSANQPLFTAFAVTLLAHESAHASGVRIEHRAECRALKTEPEAAALLGIPRALGKRLQHIYRGTIYPNEPTRYNTPACRAGLPGALVPDTLGTAADLRPLRRIAAAVAKSLKGWQNLKGGDAGGPLSPCSPIVSRTFERARFAESFSGPNHESLYMGNVRLKTRQQFATARKRYRNYERCSIARENRRNRESHFSGRFTRGRIPTAVLRLSPRVHAFRLIFTEGSHRFINDDINFFDSGSLSLFFLDFTVPAGTPIAQEVRTIKAELRSLPAGG